MEPDYPEIENVIRAAEKECLDLQPWPYYYRLRGEEMKTFLRMSGSGDFGRVLELGCGNAFNSAILSGCAKDVVASDIPEMDSQSHSIGMKPANELMKRLNVRNVSLVSAVSEEMPFKDATFDSVFSFYVMEHVRDKAKTLYEARRVLRPGGRIVSVVPSAVERVFNCIPQYKYMAGRMAYYLKKRFSGQDKAVPERKKAETVYTGSGEMTAAKFKKLYPHFPLPEPHGNYKSAMNEFFCHMPWAWIGAFKKAGFVIDSVFSTVMVPWGLFELAGGNAPLAFYRRMPRWAHMAGKFPPFKFFGNNLCVIARKR